jgi:NADPH:quinone reductase-like Zn-dependent oxidoreductase
MKAWVYDRYGSPDVLEWADVEAPTPKDDEVLIRVHAAGLNAADWRMLRGDPKLIRLMQGPRRPRRRTTVGSDVAGVVGSVGAAVTRVRPGDEVFAEIGTGGCAELVAVAEGRVAAKPSTLTFEQAAAVPMAGLTALQTLRDRGRLSAGRHVLVSGASGGVGTFTVQLAKALGAEVTGVCSARNVDLIRSIGADHVVDYASEDVTRGTQRFDLVVDIAGTHPLRHYERVLNRGGTYVLVGSVSGRFLRPIVYGKLLSLVSGRRFTSMTAKPIAEDLTYLAELIDAGRIAPVIVRTYPMDEVPDAMRSLEGGHVPGKLVVSA